MTPAYLDQAPVAAAIRPLCIDLDGTLVKSDTLVDLLLVLARREPVSLLKVPQWIAGGKANLKSHLASRVTLNVAHLPYNQPLLEYLKQEHAQGRKLYLATGADGKLARRIAVHLGIFEDVLASDGATNLTGAHKLDGLRRQFPAGEFDYIGNARPDLPLLQHATQPMTANPDLALKALLRANSVQVQRNFEDRANPLRSFIKAIRLHQWAKNVLIFVPLLLAHAFAATTVLRAALAFLCFSLGASATYIVNDLLDLEADRIHPKKRRRPFASGDLSAFTGLGIVAVFLALSLTGAMFLPHTFLGWLLVYLGSTLTYSMVLKRIVLVDVIVLSGLYTLRILAGGAADRVVISPWLAAFSIFLFLSLAMVKRFSELQNLRAAGAAPANGRGYLLLDIEQLRSFGTASAYAAVVVFTLYINGHDVAALYHHPQRMWLITPLMILWISRVWLLASRGELDEDPVVFALTDRMSLAIGVVIAAIAVAALS